MIQSFMGHAPILHPNTYVSPTAHLIGQVLLSEDVSIWPLCVLRGDIAGIEVGQGSNVQDGSILHVADHLPCRIGQYVTIGHGAIIHACTIGDNTLVGMGSTVLDGAVVGREVIIGANALIPQNKTIPDGVMVYGSPARIVRKLTEGERAELRAHALKYVKLSKVYIMEEVEHEHP